MTPTRNMTVNGNGEFFVTTTYYDGSQDRVGPFNTGEEAAREIARQEDFDAEADANMME